MKDVAKAMKNSVRIEGDPYPSVQDVIDWLSILEPSQVVCNVGGGPFSCLKDFKFVCSDPAPRRPKSTG